MIGALELERWCGELMGQLGWASVGGGIAILVAWAVCGALAKMPPGVKCWVWRVAILKLVIGLVWVGHVMLPVLPARTVSVAGAGETGPAGDEVNVTNVRVPSVHADVSRSRDWPAVVVVGLWGVGGLAMGLMYGARYFRTCRVRWRCRPVECRNLTEAYQALGRRMGLGRIPALLECEGISGPVVLGVMRPVVVAPAGFGREPAVGDAMLAHELAHVVRQDTRQALLTMAARTLFWFHPLVWLAERELGMCQESACDMAAMGVVGARALEYGRMLLDVVAASLPGRRELLGVGVISTYSSLHRRISAMRHFKTWSVRRRVFAGMVIGAVGVCAVVPWKLTAQEVKGDAGRPAERLSKDVPTTQAKDPAIDTKPVAEGERTVWPGNVLIQSVVVRASRDGTVEKVTCRPGDSVKKGQELARFESEVARSELQQAQAMLEKDEMILKRMDDAVGRGVVSSADVEAAKAGVAYDRAQLELRKHELSVLSVRAPIDGIVSEMAAHEGEFLDKGATLMTVVSVARPRVSFWIAGNLYPKVRVGQAVEFRTRAFSKAFNGRIAFISPVADAQSGMMKVEADVDDPDGGLRPGIIGEATVWVK